MPTSKRYKPTGNAKSMAKAYRKARTCKQCGRVYTSGEYNAHRNRYHK